ncbi:hypothetical protein [Thermus scotoductus]|uniref:hypothetical protein n=1 Tax=Thermus scotoductus TaxID=37636 RepID=UPI0005709439|nr:hypothetical protein [Thermus scotoductus]
MRGVFLAEALGDLGAALGFSALALEVARTGEAFWVGLLAVMGYLTLVPILLLGPWIDRAHPARALLLLRLLRGLLWLPFPLLPKEAALLVLLAYPLMVATDLAVVAWDALLLKAGRRELLENTGRLYAVWNLGGLLGSLLGPPLFLLHPALPYLGAAGTLLLSSGLLLPWLRGLSPSGTPRGEGGVPLGKALALLAGHRPLRPYLVLSLLFALAHALATALLGLLVLRAGTPEGLFGLFFALQDLGYTLGSYGAGRVPQGAALLGGPLLAGLGLLMVLLPFPFLLLGGSVYGLATGALSAHLRALRGWLLPKEGQAASLAALRVLLYGAGALGGGLAGVLGRADPALPLRLGLLGFLAFLLFLPGPLHPRRLRALARHREGEA